VTTDSFPKQGTEGRAVVRTTKQAKMKKMKFDRISRQQYVIVFNKTRRTLLEKTGLRVFLIFLS